MTCATWPPDLESRAGILLRNPVTRPQWMSYRYQVKLKILTACRLGPGLL